MANMSYCRFRNTLYDLQDCGENIGDEVESKEEWDARKRLVKLCQDIVDEVGEDDEIMGEYKEEDEEE